MTVNIIQLLIKKLDQYNELKYKVLDSKVEVEAQDQKGFTVSLTISEDGFTVHFDGWHESFVSEQEAIDCFIFGLSKKARLKVHKKGSVEYKWKLQHQSENGWEDESETGLLFYPFWSKEEVLFKQNQMDLDSF